MHEIKIDNQDYIIDFNQKALLDLNYNKVKGARNILKKYIEQEKIDEPKNTNNHTYIGIIKKHLQSKKNIKFESVENNKSDKPKNKTKKDKVFIDQSMVKFDVNNISFLIPCSGKKISEKELVDTKFILENLTFNEFIGEERKELLDLLQKNNLVHFSCDKKKRIVNNLNFSRTEKAYKIYSKGKILSSALSMNWTEQEIDKVYILSALFGIIKASDHIPLYNFAMDHKVEGVADFAKKYWKKNEKIDLIISQLRNEDIVLINLLSNNYNSVIGEDHLNLIELNLKWKDRGNQKGKWLHSQLNKLEK